jgi:hypothetical protein
MIDLAKAALNNAISLEVKKDGLQQRQSGDWTLRLVFGAIDYNEQLGRAPMGTRYACVLVEVNDDESPVDHATIEQGKWRDLGPAKQAGMRCKEPVFWAFLSEERSFPDVQSEEQAAACVRAVCGVSSRSELNKLGYERERLAWHELDGAFQAWKAAENG